MCHDRAAPAPGRDQRGRVRLASPGELGLVQWGAVSVERHLRMNADEPDRPPHGRSWLWFRMILPLAIIGTGVAAFTSPAPQKWVFFPAAISLALVQMSAALATRIRRR